MKLYAEPGEDYYHFTEVMSLLRTHSTDNIQMHCGRIRNTYAFNEVVPPTPETPPPRTPPQVKIRSSEKPTPRYSPPKVITPKPPTPKIQTIKKPEYRRDPEPQPKPDRQHVPPSSASSWGDNLSLDISLPKSPPLPPAADGKRVNYFLIFLLIIC